MEVGRWSKKTNLVNIVCERPLTHSRVNKDIGSKAFFIMATLLMPILENGIFCFSYLAKTSSQMR